VFLFFFSFSGKPAVALFVVIWIIFFALVVFVWGLDWGPVFTSSAVPGVVVIYVLADCAAIGNLLYADDSYLTAMTHLYVDIPLPIVIYLYAKLACSRKHKFHKHSWHF
jgi:hypothetical protein